MSDTWCDDLRFPEKPPRYGENEKDLKEFEKAKQKMREACDAREPDPEKAKELFQDAANLFESCKMSDLAKKAIAEKDSLLA